MLQFGIVFSIFGPFKLIVSSYVQFFVNFPIKHKALMSIYAPVWDFHFSILLLAAIFYEVK